MQDVLRINGYVLNVEGRQQLYGANLEGADLRLLNLRHADFRNANQRAADFTGADLTGADFEDASLLGANFSFAKVTMPRGWILIDGYAFRSRPLVEYKTKGQRAAEKRYKESRERFEREHPSRRSKTP
jgi:hypothetical protein